MCFYTSAGFETRNGYKKTTEKKAFLHSRSADDVIIKYGGEFVEGINIYAAPIDSTSSAVFTQKRVKLFPPCAKGY